MMLKNGKNRNGMDDIVLEVKCNVMIPYDFRVNIVTVTTKVK